MKDKPMLHRLHIILFCGVVIPFFSSCVKYHQILQKEVPQGKKRDEHPQIAQAYLRSCSFYDQFQTLAFFDVLWLSDQLKTTYVGMQSERQGKDEQSREALLRRLLEESNHWISCIVLADIRDKTHVSLSENDSAWSLFLQTKDGEKVQPISIKEIELDAEYQLFFGPRFTTFKKAYLVKFPAKPLDGVAYLDRSTSFAMTIASAKRMETLKWKEDYKFTEKKVHVSEDFYWG